MIKLDRSDITFALIAIACGGFALLVASSVLPMQIANDTPPWVIGLVGVMFVTAGVMIFLRFETVFWITRLGNQVPNYMFAC